MIILLFTSQLLVIAKSRQLSRGIELVVKFAVSSRRLNQFFEDIEDESEFGDEPLTNVSSVEFRNVTFSYGDSKEVLKNINFNFEKNTPATADYEL